MRATSADSPGHSTSSAFSAITLAVIVPVVLSTWLSTKPIVPCTTVGLPVPRMLMSASALLASARRRAPSSLCGTANVTQIGLVWLMVTSAAAASTPRTMAPTLELSVPVRPVIGARMVR